MRVSSTPAALHKLSELSDGTVPAIDSRTLRDAAHFHSELATARATHNDAYRLYPVGGYEQPTLTTARLFGTQLTCLHEIAGLDERGDGTVPRLSFTPGDFQPAHPGNHYAADNHGGLIITKPSSTRSGHPDRSRSRAPRRACSPVSGCPRGLRSRRTPNSAGAPRERRPPDSL